jgi:glycosyltransferase involved in cell wall biosynthesis
MSEPPRLLYIDDIPTPYRLGVHRVIARTWPGQYKLLFLAAGEPGRDWDFDFTGLDAEILPGRQFRPPRQVNPFSIKWNPSIAQALEAFRPSVTVLSGYVHPPIIRAAHWCMTRRIPYAIVCETSCLSTACSGWRWRARRALLSWIVRNMAFGLPVGRLAGEYLRQFGPVDVPMCYFPNTPDTSAIAAEADRLSNGGCERALRTDFGIEPEAPIVLFAGRLVDAKRPMDALATFERIQAAYPDAVLAIVGDGPLKPALETRARGSKVVFTGWLRDPVKMAGLMAIARVLVLPSAHEPWGAVVNEALAAGTPVIASDRVTSAVEMIETRVNGFLYRVGDVEALSQCIGEMLSIPPAASACMSAAARATASAFSHEFAARNLIDGALEAIGRRDCPAREIADWAGTGTPMESCGHTIPCRRIPADEPFKMNS